MASRSKTPAEDPKLLAVPRQRTVTGPSPRTGTTKIPTYQKHARGRSLGSANVRSLAEPVMIQPTKRLDKSKQSVIAIVPFESHHIQSPAYLGSVEKPDQSAVSSERHSVGDCEDKSSASLPVKKSRQTVIDPEKTLVVGLSETKRHSHCITHSLSSPQYAALLPSNHPLSPVRNRNSSPNPFSVATDLRLRNRRVNSIAGEPTHFRTRSVGFDPSKRHAIYDSKGSLNFKRIMSFATSPDIIQEETIDACNVKRNETRADYSTTLLLTTSTIKSAGVSSCLSLGPTFSPSLAKCGPQITSRRMSTEEWAWDRSTLSVPPPSYSRRSSSPPKPILESRIGEVSVSDIPLVYASESPQESFVIKPCRSLNPTPLESNDAPQNSSLSLSSPLVVNKKSRSNTFVATSSSSASTCRVLKSKSWSEAVLKEQTDAKPLDPVEAPVHHHPIVAKLLFEIEVLIMEWNVDCPPNGRPTPYFL